jgi:hypothetical protein
VVFCSEATSNSTPRFFFLTVDPNAEGQGSLLARLAGAYGLLRADQRLSPTLDARPSVGGFLQIISVVSHGCATTVISLSYVSLDLDISYRSSLRTRVYVLEVCQVEDIWIHGPTKQNQINQSSKTSHDTLQQSLLDPPAEDGGQRLQGRVRRLCTQTDRADLGYLSTTSGSAHEALDDESVEIKGRPTLTPFA